MALPVLRVGIIKHSMGARNRLGTGLSYRPARLHRLVELIPWNRFLGALEVKKFGLRLPCTLPSPVSSFPPQSRSSLTDLLFLSPSLVLPSSFIPQSRTSHPISPLSSQILSWNSLILFFSSLSLFVSIRIKLNSQTFSRMKRVDPAWKVGQLFANSIIKLDLRKCLVNLFSI